MSRTIVFASPKDLATFLWGDPGTPAGQAPTHGVLIQAKQAWATSTEPGGAERLRMALMALDRYLRENYFYPPHDPVMVPGTPRQLLNIGFRPAEADTNAAIYWSSCTMDVLSDPQTIVVLRTLIDQTYGAGFFKANIVSVRRVSDHELIEAEVHSFPAGVACDTNAEVV